MWRNHPPGSKYKSPHLTNGFVSLHALDEFHTGFKFGSKKRITTDGGSKKRTTKSSYSVSHHRDTKRHVFSGFTMYIHIVERNGASTCARSFKRNRNSRKCSR
uniref:Uncharacterized protein n=1 Tax=Timema genevievae TaxID=629358 RepID=A0A7R9PRJ5_TIMGE|nr:unnamed protein product [Timema genevievae]